MTAAALGRVENGVFADRQAIAELVSVAAWVLDKEDYTRWLELFAEQSEYNIVTENRGASRQQIVWWHSDKAELGRILGGIGAQFRDRATRTHVVTPIRIEIMGNRATALSSFALYRSPADEPSRLFLVGHYEDDLVKHSHKWLFARHRVLIHSSTIDVLTHAPL